MKFDPSLPADGINVSRTKPLREALLLVAFVLAAASAAVVALAFALDLLAPRVPARWEARWLKLPRPAGLAGEDDARAAAADALLGRLASHWAGNPYDFRVAVWDEAVPNALALPGGLVVVTSGLLERVESENELAFVLGHELGHFRNRDHLRGLGRGVAFALLRAALGASGAGGAADLATLAGSLTQRGFDREQERAADAVGLLLLHAEYGHVARAADFFERLPAPEGAAGRLGSYLSTHPLSEDRVRALHALARERGYPLYGPVRPFALPD